jgi:hypothetical protein
MSLESYQLKLAYLGEAPKDICTVTGAPSELMQTALLEFLAEEDVPIVLYAPQKLRLEQEEPPFRYCQISPEMSELQVLPKPEDVVLLDLTQYDYPVLLALLVQQSFITPFRLILLYPEDKERQKDLDTLIGWFLTCPVSTALN